MPAISRRRFLHDAALGAAAVGTRRGCRAESLRHWHGVSANHYLKRGRGRASGQ